LQLIEACDHAIRVATHWRFFACAFEGRSLRESP
jgi:hypothetical protein